MLINDEYPKYGLIWGNHHLKSLFLVQNTVGIKRQVEDANKYTKQSMQHVLCT